MTIRHWLLGVLVASAVWIAAGVYAGYHMSQIEDEVLQQWRYVEAAVAARDQAINNFAAAVKASGLDTKSWTALSSRMASDTLQAAELRDRHRLEEYARSQRAITSAVRQQLSIVENEAALVGAAEVLDLLMDGYDFRMYRAQTAYNEVVHSYNGMLRMFPFEYFRWLLRHSPFAWFPE